MYCHKPYFKIYGYMVQFYSIFPIVYAYYISYGLLQVSLTHWGRDKMAAISRRHFQIYFLEWKCMNFDWDFTEICS